MGGISVGEGHGGKKSVDSEIPLVPFIDLLLCCVMFLLVTAVWNRLARIDEVADEVGERDDAEVSGGLSQIALPDLLQLFETNGKTGTLELERTELTERERRLARTVSLYGIPGMVLLLSILVAWRRRR